MKLLLQILLVPCTILLCATSLCAQEAADDEDAPHVGDPSPNGRFAFLRSRQLVEGESQKSCGLIEKTTGKVLLRVAESDVGGNRFDVSVQWSPDSTRFALFTSYNHFGSELSVFLRTGNTFRKLKLPDISEPDVPERLKRGHEWKETNIGDTSSDGWQKDGTLPVRVVGFLHAINSKRVILSERRVVLGISKAGKVTILKSKQQVRKGDEDDLSKQSSPSESGVPSPRYACTQDGVTF